MSYGFSFLPSYCQRLDIDSVRGICKGSDQVMVYGAKQCQYERVSEILTEMSTEENPPFGKVFKWESGFPFMDAELRKTLEGRIMHALNFELDLTNMRNSFVGRPCKNALTNLVLENYKRIEEGRAIIPLLFCIDVDKNQSQITMDGIASRDSQAITLRELRRAYKLCTHENPKVRKAAEETLKFIKMKLIGDESYAMEQIAAPWADAEKASDLWKARVATSRSTKKAENVNWKMQFDKHVADFDKAQKAGADGLSAPSAAVVADDLKKDSKEESKETTTTPEK